MATRTVMFDDLTGDPGASTTKFGLDGVDYEIDLNDANTEKLREALAMYVAKARRVPRSGGTKVTGRSSFTRPSQPVGAPTGSNGHGAVTDRAQNAAIRDWAKSKGIDVNDRGRIPAPIVERYQAEAGRPAPAPESVPAETTETAAKVAKPAKKTTAKATAAATRTHPKRGAAPVTSPVVKGARGRRPAPSPIPAVEVAAMFRQLGSHGKVAQALVEELGIRVSRAQVKRWVEEGTPELKKDLANA